MNATERVKTDFEQLAAMTAADWEEINANEEARRRQQFRERCRRLEQKREDAAKAFLKTFFFQS